MFYGVDFVVTLKCISQYGEHSLEMRMVLGEKTDSQS